MKILIDADFKVYFNWNNYMKYTKTSNKNINIQEITEIGF